MAARGTNTLDRRAVVRRLLAERGELLVVAGLGSTTWDVTAAGDEALNFYLWGAMGSAVPVGLGLSLAQPRRRVLTITGDGEMLMGLGALATVAVKRPANYAIVVLDNGLYGETGGQPTHTAFGVDLAEAARAAGFPVARTLRTEAEIDEARELVRAAAGPVFVAVKVSAAKAPLVMPERDGVAIKNRFRAALLGAAAR